MLSAEQNDSQSEEINVTNESQAENRPLPVQEAETDDGKKFVVLSGLSRDINSRSPLTVQVR